MKKFNWSKNWVFELTVLIGCILIFGYCLARLFDEAALPWLKMH